MFENTESLEFLWHVTSEDEMLYALSQATQLLGLDNYLFSVRVPWIKDRSADRVFSRFSDDWTRLCIDHGDPIAAMCLARNTPVVWNACKSFENTSITEHLIENDMHNGVTFPIYSLHGDWSLFSIGSSDNSRSAKKKIESALANGQLMACHAHESMRRWRRYEMRNNRPALTKRELECLMWVSLGKSSWEIARIIDVTEHTIVHHIRNVMIKLQVRSRHQAVKQAIAFGLF